MQSMVAKYSISRSQQALLLCLLSLDLGFFSLTNPRDGGTAFVVIGSGLMIMSVYAACWVVVRAISGLVGLEAISTRTIALSISAPLIYGLLMRSIGELNMRDVLAVVPIAAVAYFYFVYGRSSHRENKRRD